MNRRLTIPLALLLILLAPAALGFGPPRQQDRLIRLSLSAGYDGRFREGRWIPLLITVSNNGPDVRAELRVRSDTTAGLNATTYRTPIDLPTQSRKQVFLYISARSIARQVMVELVSGDQVLEVVTGMLTPVGMNDLLSAVVTDSPSGSVDLSGIDLGEGDSYQANWSVENIPPLADALLSLNALVLSDVDSGRLSVEQRRALADWVLAGGHLIVTGGPNYRSTIAGVADLLPLQITGTITTDDLTPLANFSGRYADDLREPDVILATGNLRPGAQMLVEADGAPLLARRVYGEGLIDYLAADPNLAPLRNWPALDTLWQMLLATPRQLPSWSGGFQNWELASRVVQQSPGFDLPSVVQMCGLLGLYIVVIGPLNYLVLRVLRRRELAWLTIPALVIIFTVMAYFTGFSLRGTQATVNRLSVVQVWPGAERAQIDGLIGVLSPRRSTYDLTMPGGLTIRNLPQDQSYGLAPSLAVTTIEEGSVYAARDVLVDASFVSGFAVSGFVDGAPQIDGTATLSYGEGPAARVSGAITNTTDLVLQDAVALVRGARQDLGTLEPGDGATFDLPLSSRQSAPLSLVASAFGYLSAPTYYGTYYGISGYTGGLELTVQDILGADYRGDTYYYSYSTPATPELRRRQQQQDFVAALALDRDLSGGRGDRVFVVGWTHSSPLNLDLEGAPWVADDLTLYIFEIPLTVAPTAGTVEISPGFSTWIPLAEATTTGFTPYELTINGGDRAAFRFTPLPTAQLARVTGLEITARRNSPGAAVISLWDWHEESWVDIDTTGVSRIAVPDPARFVGPANAVQVLVTPTVVGTYVTYQQVDVTWYGEF